MALPSYPTPASADAPVGLINLNNNNLTIGEIIGKLLPYVYVLAGLILLLILISGGIGLMTSAGNPDKTKAASGKITGALIGFLIIFVSYMIAQIVEIVFGVKFL